MKKLVLSAVFMALFGTAFSQEEIKTDTSFVINKNKIQVTDSSKGLKIKVFSIDEDGYTPINPYYELRYDGGTIKQTKEKQIFFKSPIVPNYVFGESDIVIVNDENTVEYNNGGNVDGKENSKPVKKKIKINSFYPNYPNIYISYSQIYDSPFEFTSTIFPQRPISFEWGSYLFTTKLCYNRSNTLGIVTALGFSNTYNYLNNSVVLSTNNGAPYIYTLGGDSEIIPEGMEGRCHVDKSFIRYWSLRLPISVQVQWRMGYVKMALSAGPEFEWRFGMRSFARYEGSKHAMSKDINYNPLGVNALVVLSCDEVIIFGRFALTQMFGDGLNAIPFNVGLGFSL